MTARLFQPLSVYGGLLMIVFGLAMTMEGTPAFLIGVGLVCYVHGTVRRYTDGNTP